jgi:hypothetical protein
MFTMGVGNCTFHVLDVELFFIIRYGSISSDQKLSPGFVPDPCLLKIRTKVGHYHHGLLFFSAVFFSYGIRRQFVLYRALVRNRQIVLVDFSVKNLLSRITK